jgi:hypothetical protein
MDEALGLADRGQQVGAMAIAGRHHHERDQQTCGGSGRDSGHDCSSILAECQYGEQTPWRLHGAGTVHSSIIHHAGPLALTNG